MRITYKEVKARQKENLRLIYYNFYRRFSTPFTYVFARLDVSPSAISILNFFPSIIGYFFLSAGTYASLMAGFLFFILFKILDCSDGEVARIHDKMAMDPMHKKIEGVYFDAIGHFIEPICLGAGLGIGLFYLYGQPLYIPLGIFLAVVFTLDFALVELARSYLRKGIIERKIKLKAGLKQVQNQLMEKLSGESSKQQNIFLRLFGIYPSEGLFYSKEFIAPILLFLSLADYLLSAYSSFPFVLFGQAVGILPIYIIAVGIVKLMKILSFITRLKRHRHITEFLGKL